MTYCKAYIDKFERDGNFCQIDKSDEYRLKGYLKVRDELEALGVNRDIIYDNLSVWASRDLQTYEGESRKRALDIVAQKLNSKQKVTSTKFFVTPKAHGEKAASNAPAGAPDAGKITKEFFRTLPPKSQESLKEIMQQEKLELEDLLDIVISLGIDAYILELKGSE